MGYCWISKKKFYNSADVQNMLYFLNYHRNDKEYEVFMKYVSENSGSSDAKAIKYCIEECYYEEFDRFDSDVSEQFISYFEKLFITNTRYNNHKPSSNFIVITKKDNKYGILDISDITVDYVSKNDLLKAVRSGIKVDGVNLNGTINVV